MVTESIVVTAVDSTGKTKAGSPKPLKGAMKVIKKLKGRIGLGEINSYYSPPGESNFLFVLPIIAGERRLCVRPAGPKKPYPVVLLTTDAFRLSWQGGRKKYSKERANLFSFITKKKRRQWVFASGRRPFFRGGASCRARHQLFFISCV